MSLQSMHRLSRVGPKWKRWNLLTYSSTEYNTEASRIGRDGVFGCTECHIRVPSKAGHGYSLGDMSSLIDDKLREAIASLLPPEKPKPRGGLEGPELQPPPD